MLYYNIGRPGINLGLPVGATVGMKWFRANIQHGARLALLALVLQFGLSFGHSHAGAVQAVALAVQSVAAQSDTHNDSDQHPNENCAICAIIALAGTVLFATPPVLHLPQAEAFQYLVTDAAFIDLNPAGVAFQPRAPPAS